MDWVALVDKSGIPVVAMMAMAAGIVVTARWMAKRVDDLIDSHRRFLDHLLEAQGSIHDAMGDHAEKILTVVAENRDYLLEIRSEVKRRDKQ